MEAEISRANTALAIEEWVKKRKMGKERGKERTTMTTMTEIGVQRVKGRKKWGSHGPYGQA
jgi:predicted transcriptional regulator